MKIPSQILCHLIEHEEEKAQLQFVMEKIDLSSLFLQKTYASECATLVTCAQKFTIPAKIWTSSFDFELLYVENMDLVP